MMVKLRNFMPHPLSDKANFNTNITLVISWNELTCSIPKNFDAQGNAV